MFSFLQRQRWQRKDIALAAHQESQALSANEHYSRIRNGRYVYFGRYLFLHAIFIYYEIMCLAKGIIIPFAYNSSESGSGHNHIVI